MQNAQTVALVTGASSGIGKSIAKQLLQDGMTVYVAARRIEKMQDLKALGAIPIKMDIAQDQEIQDLVTQIEAAHGGVDILVNNAGFAIYGAVEDIPLEDARYQFEVNLFGLARLTQLLLPAMRAKGAGKIINMSSMGGKIYTPLGAWYHATKHALEGWSDCLRLELAPHGIDVVIIEPGGIKTEFGDVMLSPLLKYSGKGAYAGMAQSLAKGTEKIYANNASPPEVIAKLVAKAVNSSRPKTRYAGGFMAKPSLFLRKWISDRLFDKLIMSMG